MGSRGSGSRTTRYKGPGLKAGDIKNERDMISERASYGGTAEEVLGVANDMHSKYGESGLIGAFQVADISKSVIGYYDGTNIGMNSRFMDSPTITAAYDECVQAGFHPGRGNKTATAAVAAHEYGHALTDAVGRKLGGMDIDQAATVIVKEAMKKTSHRGVVQMAAKISRYATESNAEAIAEAVSDVYCNGNKARAESLAIVSVVDKYLR